MDQNVNATEIQPTAADVKDIEDGFAQIEVKGLRSTEAIQEQTDMAKLGTSSVGGHGMSPLLNNGFNDPHTLEVSAIIPRRDPNAHDETWSIPLEPPADQRRSCSRLSPSPRYLRRQERHRRPDYFSGLPVLISQTS